MQTIEDVDREYEKTLKEIKRLQDKLQEHLTYRNQLVPISHLPVETLTEIFAVTQKSRFPCFGGTSGRAAAIAASVCRHWRQVVLTTPLLWKTIDVEDASWIRTTLERSASMPLSIYLRPDWYEAEVARDLLSTIFSNIPRISSIHFATVWDFVFCLDSEFWKDIDWTAAKLLKTLFLRSIDVSEAFVNGGPPAVQSMTLSSCSLDWDKIPLSPLLKELTVDYPCQFSTSAAFHRCLQTVPLLEKLELRIVLLDVGPPNLKDRIPLPHLRHLHTEGFSEADVLHFFGGLSIPTKAYIFASIEIANTPDDLTMPAASLSAIQDSRAMPWHPTMLKVFMGLSYCSIKIYEDNNREDFEVLDFKFSNLGSGSLIENSCTVLDLTNLTTLDISGAFDVITDISLDLWSDTFGQLPGLQTINVKRETAQSFIKYLFFEAHFLSNSNNPNPLPRLSFLALKNLILHEKNFPSDSTNRLVSALRTRSSLGHRLHRLIICVMDGHRCDGNDNVALCRLNFANLAASVK